MSRRLLTLVPAAMVASVALVSTSYAGEAKSDKYVFTPPVSVTQTLKIKLETKATDELLKKVAEQCFDAGCRKQVDECRAHLATCVIVPSKASVHEQEIENN